MIGGATGGVTDETALPDFTVPASHPALPGHFPGNPVVPGVVLLDEVTVLIEAAGHGRVRGFPVVRFLRPVRPGETVSVRFDPPRFAAATPDGPVLRGTVSLLS